MGQYHHSRLGVRRPKSVYALPAEVDLQQPWTEFYPYPLVGTSIIFTVVIPTALAIEGEGLAKGPYRKKHSSEARTCNGGLQIQTN